MAPLAVICTARKLASRHRAGPHAQIEYYLEREGLEQLRHSCTGHSRLREWAMRTLSVAISIPFLLFWGRESDEERGYFHSK
jgi:hypothetical protein